MNKSQKVKNAKKNYDNRRNHKFVNNTEYDIERNEHGSSQYKSNTAYGPLFEHQAICSGYTDLMAIFLDKFNIKNLKISSNNHVWNGVYLNNKWLHLDLTWDDPITPDNRDLLLYDLFLIDDNKLKTLNIEEHDYSINMFVK